MDKNNNSENEVSESQIAVHWKEESYYVPSAGFIEQANVKDKNILERFNKDNFPQCFKRICRYA